jgi:hypothetical protein
VTGSIASEIRAAVADAHPAQLAVGQNGLRPALGKLTDTIQRDMVMLSDALADAYFQHASRRRTGAARRGPV